MAGKNPDGSPFCYRSVEDLTVGDLEIARVYSYLLERDPGRFPAARMGYVTKILKKEIGICNAGTPRELFGGTDSWAEPVGLFIESPLFLLREGNRNVTLAFHLTPDSVIFWRQLIAGIACGQQEEQAEIIYKILHDAFYLEISTEEGWTTVKEYVLMNEPEDGFRLIFRLNSDFPATVACRKNVHGEETDRPALKIMMNRDAWLFPYS